MLKVLTCTGVPPLESLLNIEATVERRRGAHRGTPVQVAHLP